VPSRPDELIPTRATLLLRLKDWQDQASWQEFFSIYENLIRGVALKSGLSQAEAEDVVQETMVAVAKHIPDFQYDPAVCSFKTWLLNMTRWRITDQIRRRGPAHGNLLPGSVEAPDTQTTAEIVDPNSDKLKAIWDQEWEKRLLEAALANVKRRLEPEKYQLFDFYVNKNWAPEKVAKSFNVSLNQVYLAKSRIEKLIKNEVDRIQTELI
jgi:RNA polymerase sigma factor (sigma-70 family)